MENATYIALSRLDTQQRALSVVAGNIANASTSGFKAQHVLFSDYIAEQEGAVTSGAEIESYTQDRATYRNLDQGEMQATGNPLDLALGGDGYFTLQTKSGTRLSRSGRFERLTDGTIADETGNALLNTDGQAIRLPAEDRVVSVAADGTISTETGIKGRIAIVTPNDANKLMPEGAKFLRADTPTTPLATPKVVQGMIENSNVQVMTEMTRMMQIQRDFQFMTQFVQSEATRQQDAVSKILQTSA